MYVFPSKISELREILSTQPPQDVSDAVCGRNKSRYNWPGCQPRFKVTPADVELLSGYVLRRNGVTFRGRNSLTEAAAQAKQETIYSSHTQHQTRLVEAVLTGFPGIQIFWLGNVHWYVVLLDITAT